MLHLAIQCYSQPYQCSWFAAQERTVAWVTVVRRAQQRPGTALVGSPHRYGACVI
jgi:hypothetical protein